MYKIYHTSYYGTVTLFSEHKTLEEAQTALERYKRNSVGNYANIVKSNAYGFTDCMYKSYYSYTDIAGFKYKPMEYVTQEDYSI